MKTKAVEIACVAFTFLASNVMSSSSRSSSSNNSSSSSSTVVAVKLFPSDKIRKQNLVSFKMIIVCHITQF